MSDLTAPLPVQALPDERLDQLVFRALGRTSAAVEEVLAANPNLADLGSPLPTGHVVIIPVSAARPADAPQVQLWI